MIFELFVITFWSSKSLWGAKLDFVKIDATLKRQVDFRGLEGGRGARHFIFFTNFRGRFLGAFFDGFCAFVAPFWSSFCDLLVIFFWCFFRGARMVVFWP